MKNKAGLITTLMVGALALTGCNENKKWYSVSARGGHNLRGENVPGAIVFTEHQASSHVAYFDEGFDGDLYMVLINDRGEYETVTSKQDPRWGGFESIYGFIKERATKGPLNR